MKLDLVPESMIERLLISAGLIPKPLAHTMVSLLMSRTILAAVRFGVFEALSEGSHSAEELASACGMNLDACRKLINALIGLGYVEDAESERVGLTPMSRKWLGSSEKRDLTDALMHRYLDMKLMEHSEEYLRSGESVDFHRNLDPEEWRIYVKGQRAQAVLTIPELVRRTRLPKNASVMLDLGGGHGLFADAMCRRHPNINAVVLDLPETLNGVETEHISDRVRFESGDILDPALELDRYDLVFLGNLLHHFGQAKSREIVLRASTAVRSGGVCVIADFFHLKESGTASQIPGLLDFYFAVASGGGILQSRLVEAWLREAGLSKVRTSRMLSVPGMALIVGTRSTVNNL